MNMKVLNKRHGDLLSKYVNFLLGEAFHMTEDDNDKFTEFNKLVKGIIKQSDYFTEGEDMESIHEWMLMTPNLLFHSFNGFCVGVGADSHVCSEELMARTLTILNSLSKMSTKTESKTKFINYVRD
jgi:hypothetical protein|tara:strand:- start:495 stop:872 length:378 start_codon:yes stop_codon:yes gene_type:complete